MGVNKLKLRLAQDPLSLFDLTDDGVYRVNPEKAPFAEVQARVELMLSDKEIREDVVSTARGVELRAFVPAGNTAVTDAGWEMFGSRPYRIWKGEKSKGFMHKETEKEKRLLRARRIKLCENTRRLIQLHEATHQLVTDVTGEVAFKINSHQIKTGHAFDNTKFGDVTRAALTTVVESLRATKEFGHKYDREVVEACDILFDSLRRQGMIPGSLRVSPAMLVRCVSNNDGLIPIWAHEHGLTAYSKEDDRRILRRSKGRFSAKSKIGSQITFQYTHRGERKEWQGAYPYIQVLEDYITSQDLGLADLIPVITTLERLQKSGVKDGKPAESYLSAFDFQQGDGKARSVSPLEDIPGLIEAMTIHAFNEKCKELKISHFPSVQNPSTRKAMMADYAAALSAQSLFKACDLDLSKYDKRFIMDYLVTIIQRVIKPFYHVDDWIWVDATCVAVAYKVMMIHSPYLQYARDLVSDAMNLGSVPFESQDMTFFPLWAGLMSGLRGTHIGYGSMYNLVAVQWAPLLVWSKQRGVYDKVRKMQLEGMAAGDDVLASIPAEYVVAGDPEKILPEYLSIIKDVCGQEINPKKLIWEFVFDESSGSLVKIVTYLQESHVFELNLFQVTSAARPAAALWVSEDQDYRRNPCLEAVGTISRMQNGHSDPLRQPYLEYALECSDVLRYAFFQYGANAWSWLIDGTLLSMDQITKRLGIGDFYWGADPEDFRQGRLSILDDFVVAAQSLKSRGMSAPEPQQISELLQARKQSILSEEGQRDRWDEDISEYD